MDNELQAQQLTVDELVQRCADETTHYFNQKSHDTRFCFELFRRAILERDDIAWQAIMVQYHSLMMKWVDIRFARQANLLFTDEDQKDYIAEAFEKFWRFFTPEKFHQSRSLESVLSYLQSCVNGVLLDALRKMRRRKFDQELDAMDNGEEQVFPESEPSLEERVQVDEFWKMVRGKLKDHKEYVVLYASFNLALSPREILGEYPGLFSNVKEIYKYKANVQARFEADLEIRQFFQR